MKYTQEDRETKTIEEKKRGMKIVGDGYEVSAHVRDFPKRALHSTGCTHDLRCRSCDIIGLR